MISDYSPCINNFCKLYPYFRRDPPGDLWINKWAGTSEMEFAKSNPVLH
jgi:hypothetical protein